MSKRDRINFSEFYIYEFFDHVREKTRETYDQESYNVIDELFTLLSEQDEITEGIGKLAQEQASGELSIFLFDIFDRAQDYPPTELVEALPEIAEDFVSGLSIMLEEEETIHSIKLVNNNLKGATPDLAESEEHKEELHSEPAPEPASKTGVEEESHNFTEYIEKSFISELQTALLVQSSEEDTNLYINFTKLLLNNLNISIEGKIPDQVKELISYLHRIYPWKTGKSYSPSLLMSEFHDIIETYASLIVELDYDYLEDSVKDAKIIVPEEEEEPKFEQEEIPEQPTTIDNLLSEYFQLEVDEYISGLEKIFNDLDKSPGNKNHLMKLIEKFQSFKEISMIHGYVKLEDFCSDMISLLNQGKKANNSFNPATRDKVSELLTILRKTDQFKDAKIETDESTKLNTLFDGFVTSLFIAPSDIEDDKQVKAESATVESTVSDEISGSDESEDTIKVDDKVSGTDQKSLVGILKSLLEDIEPTIKEEFSSDKPLSDKVINLLLSLESSAKIINHATINSCFQEFVFCATKINEIDVKHFGSATKDIIKIYSEITKRISPDFAYNKIEKRISKFKEKYLSDIDEIQFKETDQLLKILMDNENINGDAFVDNLKVAILEKNSDLKESLRNHFRRLSANLTMLGALKFNEFPSFFLSLVEEKAVFDLDEANIEQLGQIYKSIISLISEKGSKADIDTELMSAKESLSQKAKPVEPLVEDEPLQPSDESVPKEEAEVIEASEEEDLDEIFRQESENYLNSITDAISILDSNINDRDAYENIEKSLHSLKSSARLMGYSELADLSAPFEELFEILHSTNQSLKSGDLTIIKEVVEGLSAAIKGESIDVESFINKLRSIEISKPSEMVKDQKEEIREEQLFSGSSDEDEDLLDIFKDESAEYITIVEKATETLAKNPQDRDAPGQLEHAMHSLKSAAKMLGFSEIGQIADGVENVAVEILKGEINSTPKVNDSIKAAINLIKELTSAQKKSNDDVEKIITALDITNLKEGESGSVTDQIGEKSEKKKAEHDEQTEMFIKEGWELLEKINRDLVTLEKDPKDQSVIDNLNRTIHTLKGSAQILNFQHIGTLAHKIEDLFAKSKESKQGLSENSMDVTFKAVDTIQELLYSIKRGEEVKSTEVDLIVKQIEELLKKTGTATAAEDFRDKPIIPHTTPKIIPVDKIRDTQKDIDQVIKITTETLDNLINMAAELVINKTQLSAYLDRLREIGETLDDDKKRLRKTSRTISSFLEKTIGDDAGDKIKEEIDKNIMDDLVSVSNDFEEVMNTYDTVSRSFRTITQEFEQNIGQISTLTKSLHDDILQVRMVPTEMLFNRFPRAIRDMAKKLKKSVSLVVEGEKTEMDRALIESLTDPVMHLVRNAIDHGIETPKERKDKGKSEDGIILLKAKRDKNQILIEVQDDGAGIDPEVVKNVIIKKNLATHEELEEMSSSEIMSFVFDPGFSTRDEASDVSGRGVGLDVVLNQIQKLKGDIRIKSTPGVGTIFNIRVPLTLAIAQAMLVEVDSETLAIPLAAVEETVKFKDPELVQQDEKAFITVRDQLIPVAYLSALLNYRTEKKSAGSRSNTAIIVQESGARYGLIVDNVLRREEIVIKSLGEHLAHVPYISGGTIYGDGSVGLILDIPSITQKIESDVIGQDKDFSDIERAREIVKEESKKTSTSEEVSDKKPSKKEKILVKKKKIRGRPPKALIVDDSVSVRKFVSSVLEKNKYATVLTEDGPEALEKLRKEKFDIIITDLEMPKMHGFDLIEELRSYKKYQSIPIVILTGRAGKKHKDKGKELGANAYITKPFKENDLLKSLEDFIEIV
jgi:chemosensory pili system protein ChpA (sensor histidine kinase/response regulator)